MKKVLIVVGVLVVAIAVWVISKPGYGEKLEFNGTEVYYTESVNKADAQKLGAYLLESGFADGGTKSVQLSKPDSAYHFRMVVKEGVEKDSANDITFQALAMTLSWSVFNNETVVVEACDNTFNTLRVYQ
ncbi:hypothetical protein [Roseivirga pacifica]|uniref:hypothetical protein n=1 Tax=Roseivirga pacifica TaxID=1267423 RepID=UPI003BB10133